MYFSSLDHLANQGSGRYTEKSFRRLATRLKRSTMRRSNMSSSFRIHSHRQANRVCLKLRGDFDGSDALKLTDVLKAYRRRGLSIQIDADGLATIHPFGLQCFQHECARNNLFDQVTFSDDRERPKDSSTTPLKRNGRLFHEYHAHDIGPFG